MTADDKIAYMTREEFDKLPEYSYTVPTGTTVGKVWRADEIAYTDDKDYSAEVEAKRRLSPDALSCGWLLGEYVKHEDPKYVGVRWRTITIVAPGVCPGRAIGVEPVLERRGRM